MGYDGHGPETIGALLARMRAERGITQLRLAERLCGSAGVCTVTRNEVSRWERGERIPSSYWRGWLAATLDLPRDQLDRAAAISRDQRQLPARAAPRSYATTIWVQQAEGVYSRVAC
jgi:transcriptional regulator with XRE-family HTH domain